MSVEDVIRMINRENKAFLLAYVFDKTPSTLYEAELIIMQYFGYNLDFKSVKRFRKSFPSLSQGSIKDHVQRDLRKAVSNVNKKYFVPRKNITLQNIASFSLSFAAEKNRTIYQILGKSNGAYNIARILEFLYNSKDVRIEDLVENLNLSWGSKSNHLERLRRYGYIDFYHIKGKPAERKTDINLTEKGREFVSKWLAPIIDYENNQLYFLQNKPSIEEALDALWVYIENIKHPESKRKRRFEIIRLVKQNSMTRKAIRNTLDVRVWDHLNYLTQQRRIHVDKSNRPYVYSLN